MRTNDDIARDIDASGAPLDMVRAAKLILGDALTRKAVMGEFDMYAAYVDGSGKIHLIANPLGEKDGFTRIIQIVGVALDAGISAIVSESWYLDPASLTPEEYAAAAHAIKTGMPVSRHPKAVETITVHMRDDATTMLMIATLLPRCPSASVSAFVAACDRHEEAEITGTMTDIRVSRVMAERMRLMPGLLPTGAQLEEIRMKWMAARTN